MSASCASLHPQDNETDGRKPFSEIKT